MGIEEIKRKVNDELNGDPFSDPHSWELIEKRVPTELWQCLTDRAGAAKFVASLPDIFKETDLCKDKEAQRCWERIGNFYKNQHRFSEALSIYVKLYEQLLTSQKINSMRCHKGVPLVWISDCCSAMNLPAHAKRYLMLSLCEDAISESGLVSPDRTGTYFRLVWSGGILHSELYRYASEIFELAKDNPNESLFPEWLVQHLDQNWMTEFPTPREASMYMANTVYINHILSQLGETTGRKLEQLAEYVLSCMPGCRTYRRERSGSTDYDIVCSMEGVEVDFRSELGRHFVCECKDWQNPVDFSSFAKFCRVLDSTKSKFGILFSSQGITGERKTTDAEREQRKVFHDRGMVIIVVNNQDLRKVSLGYNFINILRTKYEKVRLDLITDSMK